MYNIYNGRVAGAGVAGASVSAEEIVNPVTQQQQLQLEGNRHGSNLSAMASGVTGPPTQQNPSSPGPYLLTRTASPNAAVAHHQMQQHYQHMQYHRNHNRSASIGGPINSQMIQPMQQQQSKVSSSLIMHIIPSSQPVLS